MFFIADNLVNGSIRSCDIDSKGKKRFTEFLNPNFVYTRKTSKRNHMKRKPKANAERLINIPTNKQDEKNPTRFAK